MPIIFVLIGLVAGVLSGLLGIGGGVVIVPMLVLLTSMPILTATGTSLGALLLPVGLLGAWAYYKEGHLDVRGALLIAAGLTVGAYLGARMAQSIPPTTLRKAFSVLLVLIAARMWFTG
jgi:uncharacterized membrane protein YfcA